MVTTVNRQVENKFGQEERFFSLLPSVLAGNFQKNKRDEKCKVMKDTYIEMTKYLLKSLPLKSNVLKDAACLGPLTRKKEWTVQSIGRLALQIPHIIQEREVSLVKDEWKLYRLEEIPVE